MSTRRTDLPQTVKECHQLILELYDTIDELRARVAELERELYGWRRERFLAGESEIPGKDKSARRSIAGDPPLSSDDDSTSSTAGPLTDNSSPSDNGTSDLPASRKEWSPSTVDSESTSAKPKRTS